MNQRLAKTTGIRRFVVLCCLLAGGLLMFLAPATWAGVFLLGLGILIEIVGMALARR